MTDDDLRELLTDAVSDVEPAYRLDTIKARTRRGHPRRGWYAAGTAILAAAAVVTAVSVVNDDRPRREGPAADPDRAAALYFVGETPAGPRLYREFQRLSGGPLAALEAITTPHGARDPDYTTEWPKDSFESVTVTEQTIDIELGPAATSLRMRSPINVQQVVYTIHAATGELLPIQFTYGGQTVDGMLYERAPENERLALVSISDPAEGLHVKDSFVARGRANSPEANVPWQIKDESDEIVLDGFATAAGWGDRLYKWETDEIDVSELSPGTYEFVAMTDDPSGGEGRGPFTDTRTIVVEAPSAAPSESGAQETGEQATATVPVYFVGDTPQGARLFREFSRTDAGAYPPRELIDALQNRPDDPDYRTLWPESSFRLDPSDPEAGIVFVTLARDLSERPEGMSAQEASLALQQVVFSIQAAFQERLDVGFLLRPRDGPMDEVLGVPGPYFNRAPENDVLSLISISDPVEGLHVKESFVARGRANAYEATVPWEIRDDNGIVKEGFTTAAGSVDRLYPWETERIDVSDLAPGQYAFIAYREGDQREPYYDTRWITVE